MDGVRARIGSETLTIGEDELLERFSRSSGPGGQSVNTADSRVELRWDVAASAALSSEQRDRAMLRMGPRLVDGVLVVFASEFRSQLQNRVEARARIGVLLGQALAPPPPPRRPTRPSRGARQRRLTAKQQRGATKLTRRRPRLDD